MRRKVSTFICFFFAAAGSNTYWKYKKMASESTSTPYDEAFEKRPADEERVWGGTRYHCYWEKFRRPSLSAVFKWKFNVTNESAIPQNEEILEKYMPVLPVKKEKLSQPPDGKMQVTWIGHATVLVQLDGITILSDPLFRDFCGPEAAQYIKSLGYRRYREAACNSKNIPKLDVVIISHNHFDHLDRGSVKEIYENHKGVKWFVPMKTREWFTSHGVEDKTGNNIVEMNWWEEKEMETENGKKIKFICTPSQHWCQRGALDLNKMLWCSWVVKGPNHSYFFAGDTGYYGPLFKKIGEDYGPFSLAAIPIGAYNPRNITEYQHVDPEEAVKIHEDVKSRQSVGIHWGTFELTNEFFLEPPNKVKEHMEKQNLDHKKFVSLKLGETWTVGEERDDSPFMGIDSPSKMKEGDDTL